MSMSMNTTYVSESTESNHETDKSSYKASAANRFDVSANTIFTITGSAGDFSVRSSKSGKSNKSTSTVRRVRKVRPPPLLLSTVPRILPTVGYATLGEEGLHGDVQTAVVPPPPQVVSPFVQLEIDTMPSFSSYTTEHAAVAAEAARAATAPDTPSPLGKRPPLSPPPRLGSGSSLEAARSHRPSESVHSSPVTEKTLEHRKEDEKKGNESGSSYTQPTTELQDYHHHHQHHHHPRAHPSEQHHDPHEAEGASASLTSVQTDGSGNSAKGPQRRRVTSSPASGATLDEESERLEAPLPSPEPATSATLAPQDTLSPAAIVQQLRYELRMKRMEQVQVLAEHHKLEGAHIAQTAALQAKERAFALLSEEVETRERQFTEQATQIQATQQSRAAYLQQLRLTHSALQGELASARVELDSLAARVAQSEEEKKRVEEHRSLTNRKIASLEGTLPVEEGFLVETQRQTEQQEAELAAKAARVAQRREDVRLLRVEVEELEAEVERLQLVAAIGTSGETPEGETDAEEEVEDGTVEPSPLSARTAEAAARLRALTELERDMNEICIAQTQRAALEAYICGNLPPSPKGSEAVVAAAAAHSLDYSRILQEQENNERERYDTLVRRLEEALQWSEEALVNARAELYLVRSRR